MEIKVKIEIVDDDEVLYEKTKSSGLFQLEPFYDRMVFTQITEIMKTHKDIMKKESWFERLRGMRGK